jgi:excisionase family DNA binding protein
VPHEEEGLTGSNRNARKRRPPVADLATCIRPWITPGELAGATEVDCHERTIRKMIDAGSIQAIRVGRCYRIPVDEACRVFRVKRALDTSRAPSRTLHA